MALAGLLLPLAHGALAETGYIADRIEVGLHAERSAHSVILELLPSGTAVEVLERDGDAARVRLDDGREGWVGSGYLTADLPAGVELAQAREQLAELRPELARAQQRMEEIEAALASEQSERLAAEARSAAAQEELAGLRDGLPARGEGAGGDAERDEVESRVLRDYQRLAEENRQLKEQLAEVEATGRGAAAGPGEAGGGSVATAPRNGPGARPPGFFERPFWHWLVLCLALALSFGLGAFAVDWNSRRRHGGYRI